MRKLFTILMSLCISALMYAGTDTPVKHESRLATAVKKTMPTVNSPERFMEMRKARINQQEESEAAKTETTAFSTKQPQRNPAALEAMLESVVSLNPDGSNFVKEAYEFDEDYYDIKRIRYQWDGNDWLAIEVYEYEWDENHNVTKIIETNVVWGESITHEFTYTLEGWKESEIQIVNGDNFIKSMFAYDERGNIIDEISQNWEDGQWVNSERAENVYDEQNRELEVTSYFWGGATWDPAWKQTFAYDANGNRTLWNQPQWDGSEWVNEHKIEFEFDQDNKPLKQWEAFWTGTDWNGNFSSLTTWVYLDDGRVDTETFTEYFNGFWDELTKLVFDYADNGTDDLGRPLTRATRYSYFNAYYDEPGVTYIRDYFIGDFTPKDKYADLPSNAIVVYDHVSDSDNGPLDENHFHYNADGLFLGEEQYALDSGTKLATYRTDFEHDDDDNVILQHNYEGNKVDDEWILVSKFEYTYENGVRTKKFRYTTPDDGDTWLPSFDGFIYDYDFSVPLTNLVVNADYSAPYKINAYYDYNGDGADGWLIGEKVYNWVPLGSEEEVLVVSHTPEAGATNVPVDTEIKVVFNQDIEPSTLPFPPAMAFLIGTNMEDEPMETTVRLEGNTLYLDYEGTLENNKEYSVELMNQVEGFYDFISWTFTTEEASLEVLVVSHTPEAGATNVPVNTEIKVVFNQDIEPSTLPFPPAMAFLIGTNMEDEPMETTVRLEGNTLYLDYEGTLENNKEYSVELMNQVEGFYDFISWTFTTIDGVAIGNVSAEFAVYPNPTTGPLTVKKPDNHKVYLYDITGALVFETTATDFSIGHLSAGVYLLKTGDTTVRIVKK